MPGQISSTALVRYRLVDYSAPTVHAHKKVMVKGYVDRVEIALGAEIVARHRRSYVRGDVIYEPLHYLSLLEKKPGALRTRRRRCGDGSSIPPLTRCAASSRRASARAASANTSRCCACTKTSRNAKWRPRCAMRWQRRLIGFDAVKHLLLAASRGGPCIWTWSRYPHLPQPFVAATQERKTTPPCWPEGPAMAEAPRILLDIT